MTKIGKHTAQWVHDAVQQPKQCPVCKETFYSLADRVWIVLYDMCPMCMPDDAFSDIVHDFFEIQKQLGEMLDE